MHAPSASHNACPALDSTMPAIHLLQVEWHRSHEEIPQDCPAIVVANEFFDALPVHHFQRSERGWSEVLVDIAENSGLLHLRNVLAPTATPASRLLLGPRLQSLQQGESRSPAPGVPC